MCKEIINKNLTKIILEFDQVLKKTAANKTYIPDHKVLSKVVNFYHLLKEDPLCDVRIITEQYLRRIIIEVDCYVFNSINKNLITHIGKADIVEIYSTTDSNIKLCFIFLNAFLENEEKNLTPELSTAEF